MVGHESRHRLGQPDHGAFIYHSEGLRYIIAQSGRHPRSSSNGIFHEIRGSGSGRDRGGCAAVTSDAVAADCRAAAARVVAEVGGQLLSVRESGGECVIVVLVPAMAVNGRARSPCGSPSDLQQGLNKLSAPRGEPHAHSRRRRRCQLEPPARRGPAGSRLCRRQAFDGEEGHFLGDTEPYDAVILDIGYPKWTASPCWKSGAPQAVSCRY